MLSWVSPVLGWALKCLAQGHSHEKTQRIQCGSNPGPLDYKSNTLPLGHAGPLQTLSFWTSLKFVVWERVKCVFFLSQQPYNADEEEDDDDDEDTVLALVSVLNLTERKVCLIIKALLNPLLHRYLF